MLKLPIGVTIEINRNDPALYAWISDMELVDTAVPQDGAEILIWGTDEFIATIVPHEEN